MTNVTEQCKQGVGHALESLSDGWRELKARAGGAMTRFRSHEPQETGQENWPEAAFQPTTMISSTRTSACSCGWKHPACNGKTSPSK
jgi:hypothetical protein